MRRAIFRDTPSRRASPVNDTGFPDDADGLSALLARAGADAAELQAHRFDPEVVAAGRRRRRRKRIVASIVAFVIVAAIGTYVPATLLAPADAATATVHPRSRSPPPPC
jgi:putative intracellular protease/amidase